MPVMKTYTCSICNTTPDQLSHHKVHLATQKHKDKRELYMFRLSNSSSEELTTQYGTTNVQDIVSVLETQLYMAPEIINTNRKKLIQTTIPTMEPKNKRPHIIHENTLTEHELTMSEQSNNISSREALKDKVHEIHNFLRNNGAGYGMTALKMFNIFFGLKKIEEKGLFEKTGLVDECRFSNLLGLTKAGNDELLLETILNTVLDAIHNSILKGFLFYEIPKDMNARVFVYLLEQIEEITVIERTCDVLLSGNIYEYFIGRDESAISELGAYFTVRWITRYCMGKSNLCLNEDGSIPTMIDMFGGSGGFTTEYIRHFVQNYPELDWETQLSRVSHYDMNEDVVKSAALEFFCLTGVIPKMGTDGQLCRKNSFCDDFGEAKYQRILTNPPYGGDKTKKTEAQSKDVKIKEYITRELPTITDMATRISRQVQLDEITKREKEQKKKTENAKVSVDTSSARIQRYANKYNLKGTDKEAISLIQFMDMVEVGGRVVGVLKEGVFFDKSYRKLREHLIRNYNVREVISVPQDQFENTQTKTSILVFDNVEEKTTKVVFRELVVEKYTEDKFVEVRGKIVLAESVGDIRGVSDAIVSEATVDELLTNRICSFNGKDYGKKELVVGDDYSVVNLGSICEFLPKSKRQASYGNPTGEYPFYTSSDKMKRCDVSDYTEPCVLIGTGGNSCIHYTSSEFSCSTDVLLLKSSKLNQRYIYYMLVAMKHILIDGMRGTTIKHVTKEMVINFTIPVSKSPEKTQQWVDYISAPYNEKNTKQSRLDDLETFVKNRILEITTTEDCDEKRIGELTKMLQTKKYNTSYGKRVGKYQFYNSSQYENLFCDEYDIEDKSIIIGFKGNINIHFGKQFTASQHMYVLQLNDKCPSIQGNVLKWLFYYLKYNKELFTNQMHGTTIQHITKPDLNNIKIKLPKKQQLIGDFEPVFEEIEILQQEIKDTEKIYQSRIQELACEALPEQPLIANVTAEIENMCIEAETNTDANEISDDNVSLADSVVTTSTTNSGKKLRKPRSKKEPGEKVAKENKPAKETKPRKPRSKKEPKEKVAKENKPAKETKPRKPRTKKDSSNEKDTK